MSIRDIIQDCKLCPLFNNMQISPIAPEIFGANPLILFVFGSTPTQLNDLSQEVITGANRVILSNLCKDFNISYATTFLIKCQKNSAYKKTDFKTCCTNIQKEVSCLGVKSVIGFGKSVSNYIECDYCFDSVNIALNNKKKLEQIKKSIQKVKNDFS